MIQWIRDPFLSGPFRKALNRHMSALEKVNQSLKDLADTQAKNLEQPENQPDRVNRIIRGEPDGK